MWIGERRATSAARTFPAPTLCQAAIFWGAGAASSLEELIRIIYLNQVTVSGKAEQMYADDCSNIDTPKTYSQ